MLEVFDRHYAAAAGVSWILSYAGLCVPKIWHVRRYGSRSDASRSRAICGRCRRSERCGQFRKLASVLADYDPTLIQNYPCRGCGSPCSARCVVRFDARGTADWSPWLNPAVTFMKSGCASPARHSAPCPRRSSKRAPPAKIGAMVEFAATHMKRLAPKAAKASDPAAKA